MRLISEVFRKKAQHGRVPCSGTAGRVRLILLCYQILFLPVLLCILPAYLSRMVRRGNWRRNFQQRFGYYPKDLRRVLAAEREMGLPGRLWIQAVSVGELFIAFKLIEAMRKADPDCRIILSTTTTTGFVLAEKKATGTLAVVYTPIDFILCVHRAWNAFQPRAMVVIEGGLWPNLVHVAKERGCPVVLCNARVSPRSERRFLRFRRLIGPIIFEPLDLLIAPEKRI